MANKLRRCWDSVCCFGYLANQAGRAAQCERVLQDAEEGHCEIVMSALAIAEVLKLKGEGSLPRDSRDRIRSFFRRSMFLIVDVDRFIAEQAQDLYWEHGIRPKDAVHVATAIATETHYLETFDGPLLQRSRLVGGDPQLVIHEPGADLAARVRTRSAAKRAIIPLFDDTDPSQPT